MKSLLKSTAAIAALLVLSAGAAGAMVCDLTGTSGDNTLTASDPNCNWTIKGLAGDDTLTGDAIDDKLWPGTQSMLHSGHDVMTGGGGSDWFIFEPAPSLGSNADEITDFTHNVDTVNLYFVCHAASVTCSFIGGSPFSGTAGEVRYSITSGSGFGLLQADLDGDQTSDFDVKLDGAPTFTSGDFSNSPPPAGARFQPDAQIEIAPFVRESGPRGRSRFSGTRRRPRSRP